jgi:hypothetical protein
MRQFYIECQLIDYILKTLILLGLSRRLWFF